MTDALCPVCGAVQSQALVCHSCTTRLERDLGDVAAIVADLDISLSKQARIGNAGGGGLARERSPMNVGAMNAADELANVLTTWARDVCGEGSVPTEAIVSRDRDARTAGPFCLDCRHRSCQAMRVTQPIERAVPVAAAWALLSDVPAIRRHPAAAELVDEITDAIGKARRTVDRPADRIYLGQCLYEEGDVTCYAELWARPGAGEVKCKVCGVTHPVTERRVWLLERAKDMLFTAAEASQMMGEIGHITVSQASIRGYIHRGRLAYRAPVTAKRIRLGDLLDVVMDDSEKRTA